MMTLSSRLSIAMVTITLLAAAAVGSLVYTRLEATLRPTMFQQLTVYSAEMADQVVASVQAAKADARAIAQMESVRALARAADGTASDGGRPSSYWKDRIAEVLTEIGRAHV